MKLTCLQISWTAAPFFLVEDDLVFLEQVAAVGVDGHDQRTKLLHVAAPQRLGHAELVPVVRGDPLDLCGRDDCAAGREDAMDGLEGLAGVFGVRTHAALADDDLHAGLLNEFLLELFHMHRGRRADGNHFIAGRGGLGRVNDGACVEDRLAVQIDRQLALALNQTAVRHVAAGDEIAVEIDDIADMDIRQILCGDRRDENLLSVSVFNHYSVTPLCEITVAFRSLSKRTSPRRCDQQPTLTATPMVDG